MSERSLDALKAVEKLGADATAFRLVQALADDLQYDLPHGFASYVSGRARARDYEFFVETLPKFASALASAGEGDNEAPWKFRDTYLFESTQQVEAVYLLGNLLKKYPFRESKTYTDERRECRALASFHKANKWCRRMNRLGRRHSEHPLIVEARRAIRQILPAFSWEAAVKRAYFGPGVNVGVSWDETDAQVKLYLDKTLTSSLSKRLDFAASFVPAYLYYEGVREARGFDYPVSSDPGTWEVPISQRYSWLVALGLSRFKTASKIVAGSKFATVPKDALTFRSIAAEPSLNSFLQNGIGKWLREILASFSAQLDCSDQQRNRDLAYAGSAAGIVATIDLSSASDTVSMQLVRNLLPLDWYLAMRLVRSPKTKVNEGRACNTHNLHMFSSMGNGYTFPLETLVFYGIAVAAIRLRDADADVTPNQGGPGANREPSVYGDDIIVANDDAPAVLKALRDCGFWPNAKKSFHAGPFRESCGHDYRAGNYIRPIFIRRPLEWTFDVISLLNHLSNPAGLGWYSARYGTYFSSFCKRLVEISKAHPAIPMGPVGSTHVVTHVRLPLRILRQFGGTAKHDTSEDGRTRTEYFYPLRVTPRKFKDVEDISVYLKGLLAPTSERPHSLYTRVKRGEVVVRLPRKDGGQPILGWVEDLPFEAHLLRYLPILRGIRWFRPTK